MKKSARHFLKYIFMALCLYTTQALAIVDPPTFAPMAPNSAQSITVSVRYGVCDALGIVPNPGGRPQRIEYSINAIDIFTPGFTNPSGFCNIPFNTTQFSVLPRDAGTYQVRIWMLNDLAFPVPATTLVSQATITVTQGALLTPVPTLGFVGSAILIALVFFVIRRTTGTKRLALFSIAFLVSSAGFAQSNEKALLILLSAAPGAPAPISLVQPVSFSGGYLGALSPGFAAENPTRAFYLLPRRATGNFDVWIHNNPNEARAKLEREVIIVYPQAANLQNALTALRNDPNVLYAEQMPMVNFATPAQNYPLHVPDTTAKTVSGSPSQTWITDVGFDRAWTRAGGWSLVATIDNGLNTAHPDLIAFDTSGNYTGGNFLPVYAADAGRSTSLRPPGLIIENNVDERQAVTATAAICDPDGDGLMVPSFAGHGSHVAGLISANNGNGDGTQGACKNCGLAIWRVGTELCEAGTGTVFGGISPFGIIASLTYTTDFGAQVVSQSFGFSTESVNDCAKVPDSAFCLAITNAHQRGVVMVASSGNARSAINFPAEDPRVVAVGGLEPDLSFWNDRLDLPPSALIGECPNLESLGQECGSNFTLTNPGERRQEITMPARDVYSTAYPGATWNQFLECGDATDGNANDGRGLCTGTSMSAPLYSGLVGLLRSINPLLLPGNPENAADAIGIRGPMFNAVSIAYLPTALSKTMQIVLDTETTGLKPDLGNRSRSGSSAVSSAFIVKPGVNFSGASAKPSGDAS